MANLGRQPFPPDHPLRRGVIIFSPRRPSSSETPSGPVLVKQEEPANREPSLDSTAEESQGQAPAGSASKK